MFALIICTFSMLVFCILPARLSKRSICYATWLADWLGGWVSVTRR